MGLFPIKVEKLAKNENYSSKTRRIISRVSNGVLEMIKRIHAAFTTHPASVDESYGEHFIFAMTFAGKLGFAAFAALVHAVLPFAFEKTASMIIRELYERTHNRG